ncbi:MAG TPA: IS5/IS1182 family transposase, partial [Acidimicrobiia bacterium]
RSIAWLVRGCRRLRYRGTDRNQLWLADRAAAVNLQRLLTLGLTRRPDRWAIA